MKISVICVGRLKEKYWTDAVAEYTKRLSKYVKLEITELPDEKAPESMSAAQEEQVKTKEGQRILKAIKEDAFVITLEVQGKQISSEELAQLVDTKATGGVSHIAFVIGGSLGLSDEVISRAGYHLSFSKMTFPHQMMRVVLLEQIYRAVKINKNEPYHK
ncbi:MAG: 23S rRNA (pseudouridine(1915)-N(3))-methyltransferase RlmH [Lachnospiraceae bacterium]|nr:23S rRNA (pseudouridine(1915)-N(3))-methyltransferase RlmH [Lachnospiraceae bacterium]